MLISFFLWKNIHISPNKNGVFIDKMYIFPSNSGGDPCMALGPDGTKVSYKKFSNGIH